MKPQSRLGVAVTELKNGVYNLNGTASPGIYARICDSTESYYQVPAGTYTFRIVYEDSTKTLDSNCGFFYNTTTETGTATLITRGAPVTLTFETSMYIFFRIANNGSEYTNLRLSPMVSKGSEKAYLPNVTAVDYIARYGSEYNANVCRSDKFTAFYSWNLPTKTLTIKNESFCTKKGGLYSTVKAQTVDFSDVKTTYDAYRIMLDYDGYVHGKAWNDPTETEMVCIGVIYGNYIQIFGFVDSVLSSRNMVYCFGDSITAGVNCTRPYHLILAQKTGVICLNWGVGSTGFVATASGSVVVGDGVIGDGASKTESGNNTVLNIMTGKLFNSCIIFAGTNDYGTNVPISTFRTAVQNTLDYALTQTNNILVITPLKRYYNNVPYTQENSAGHTLKDYADVIIEECETRSIGYVNGFNIDLDPTVAQIKSRLMDDGLHPNNEGQNRVAGAVYSKFLENCYVM
jgi:lysophospholipase L1-like esterase